MESTNRKRRFWDYIGLLVCVISWGSAFVVVRSAAAHMTPMTMTMFRLVFAALFFLPNAVKHPQDNTPPGTEHFQKPRHNCAPDASLQNNIPADL